MSAPDRNANTPADLGRAAVKFDGDKPRMELLPPKAMEEVAKVLTVGAKKYSDYNWRKGFDWTRLIGAAYRHLSAFSAGEDKDPETGLSHIAHAACCLMFLVEHETVGFGRDDRYKDEDSKTTQEAAWQETIKAAHKANQKKTISAYDKYCVDREKGTGAAKGPDENKDGGKRPSSRNHSAV